MKPKTIREVLTQMWQDARDEDDAEETIHQALVDIQQLIEECVPENKYPEESWKNRPWMWQCQGFNQAIDQYKSNLMEKFK